MPNRGSLTPSTDALAFAPCPSIVVIGFNEPVSRVSEHFLSRFRQLDRLDTDIITRLYGPSDYGLLALFNALIFVCWVMAALHFEAAVALPNQEKDGMSVLVLSLLTVGATTILITICTFLFGPSLADLAHAPELPMPATGGRG